MATVTPEVTNDGLITATSNQTVNKVAFLIDVIVQNKSVIEPGRAIGL